MLRRLSVHAAGLSEPSDTYIWEDLSAHSFEGGAAEGFGKIEAQRHYAIAGTLHLDHLAALRHSAVNAPTIRLNAFQLAQALNESQASVKTNLDRLLSEHEKEWRDFVTALGRQSFIARWIEQPQ
jgi:hypothetical protein